MLDDPEYKINRKKLIFVCLAIILFLVGYFLAPPTMTDGDYTGTIIFNHNNPLGGSSVSFFQKFNLFNCLFNSK